MDELQRMAVRFPLPPFLPSSLPTARHRSPSPSLPHSLTSLSRQRRRNWSNDTLPTKEEQLLGYTSQQRQRMKALHILGLTEESFDRCRAVMLSSLGPSAFGYSADETAASAVSAEAEEGWTPGDKFRRRAAPSGGGGGHHHTGILRMPTFSPSR